MKITTDEGRPSVKGSAATMTRRQRQQQHLTQAQILCICRAHRQTAGITLCGRSSIQLASTGEGKKGRYYCRGTYSLRVWCPAIAAE